MRHRISVRFDGDLWRWLQDEAQRRRLSISTFVAHLVAAEMGRQKP